jgi:hypothetical protein
VLGDVSNKRKWVSPVYYVTNWRLKCTNLEFFLLFRENWFLTHREEYGLMMFEKNVLRRTCWSKIEEVTEDGKYYIMRFFIICILQVNRVIKLRRIIWAVHASWRREVHGTF